MRSPLTVGQQIGLIGHQLRASGVHVQDGPYLVARAAADGGVRLVLRARLSWLRACRLVNGLPDDYVMRLGAELKGDNA
jgi:hypothetical protein